MEAVLYYKSLFYNSNLQWLFRDLNGRSKSQIVFDDTPESLLNWSLFECSLGFFERLFDVFNIFEEDIEVNVKELLSKFKFMDVDVEQFMLDLGNFLVLFKKFEDLQPLFSSFLENLFLLFYENSGEIFRNKKGWFDFIITAFKFYGVKELSKFNEFGT